MKERPILMSAPMVNALLSNAKTQTRRTIKPQPEYSESVGFIWKGKAYGVGISEQEQSARKYLAEKCPYGEVGDRLWVRETCWINEDEHLVSYRADGEFPDHMKGEKWKPSIFMPRWASRITLEITDIRVQRLEDISNDDAKAEGVDCAPHRGGTCGVKDTGIDQCAICPYRDLWNTINGPKSWNENPWVWCLSFRRS